MGMNIRSPSLSGRHELAADRRARPSAPRKSRAAVAIVTESVAESASQGGPIETLQATHHGVVFFAWTFPPSSRVQSTGTSVTETTVAASTAKSS